MKEIDHYKIIKIAKKRYNYGSVEYLRMIDALEEYDEHLKKKPEQTEPDLMQMIDDYKRNIIPTLDVLEEMAKQIQELQK